MVQIDITLTPGGNESNKYTATIRGIKAWAVGETMNAALGELVRSNQKELGLEVSFPPPTTAAPLSLTA